MKPDSPPIDKEGDHEMANTKGELSSTSKKRKLNQPEDINYCSDNSGRRGREDNQSPQPRKQQKPPASWTNSPCHSQVLHERTRSNFDTHDISYDLMGNEPTELIPRVIIYPVRGSTDATLVDNDDGYGNGGDDNSDSGKDGHNESNKGGAARPERATWEQPTGLRRSHRYRALKPLVTDYSDSEETPPKTASHTGKTEEPIQGFLQRKRDGSYIIEFLFDTLPLSPRSPIISRAKQRRKGNLRSSNGLNYTKDEDTLLMKLKEEHRLTWKEIGRFLSGRTLGSLQVRYLTQLKRRGTVLSGDDGRDLE